MHKRSRREGNEGPLCADSNTRNFIFVALFCIALLVVGIVVSSALQLGNTVKARGPSSNLP